MVKSEPDGHTLLMATLSTVTTPALSKTSWQPTRDLAGVAMMGHVANVALVHPSLPVQNLKEIVEYARTRPGRLNYINAGIGTSPTMAMELFKKNTGIFVVGIGYRGFPPAIPDMLAGEIQFSFMPFGVAAPHVRAGKLRLLAVAAPARNRQFPDAPTMAEAGFGDSQVISWYAFMVAAGTPRALVTRLNAELAKALGDTEVQARIEKIGGDPLPPGKPEEVDAMVARELERWTKLVQATGLKID